MKILKLHFIQKVAALLLFFGVAQALHAELLPLWEVSSPRGKAYLLGSIHVCRSDCFPLPTTALKRFTASDVLMVELDARRPDLQSTMAAAGNYPQGDSLEKHLSTSQWQLLQSVLTKYGIPPQAVQPMRPWMTATIVMLVAAQRLGYEVEQGVDLWFMSQADAAKKPIVELETAQRQLQALTYGGDKVQISGLEAMLRELDKDTLGPYLEDLLRSWRRGDAKKLDALMRDERFSGQDNEAWTAELLDKRNVEMASKIAQAMESGKTAFVVVGVAHLVGANNVGDMLKQKGYKLRQLSQGE